MRHSCVDQGRELQSTQAAAPCAFACCERTRRHACTPRQQQLQGLQQAQIFSSSLAQRCTSHPQSQSPAAALLLGATAHTCDAARLLQHHGAWGKLLVEVLNRQASSSSAQQLAGRGAQEMMAAVCTALCQLFARCASGGRGVLRLGGEAPPVQQGCAKPGD